MGRIAGLRAQAQRRTGNLYDTLFTRRVSIYLTWALRALGVGPNAVSAANTVVALTASACLGLGVGVTVLAGVALVHVYAVLDSVDGELARLTRRFSLKGLFLEDLNAYLFINGFWLAIGGYLWRTQDEVWPFMAAVALAALFRNAGPVARRAILKSIDTRRPVSATRADGPGRARPVARVKALVDGHLLHQATLRFVVSTLVLVEEFGLGHRHGLVMIAFAVASVGFALRELAAISLYLFTGALDAELATVYERARTVPREPADGMQLSGDKPPT